MKEIITFLLREILPFHFNLIKFHYLNHLSGDVRIKFSTFVKLLSSNSRNICFMYNFVLKEKSRKI